VLHGQHVTWRTGQPGSAQPRNVLVPFPSQPKLPVLKTRCPQFEGLVFVLVAIHVAAFAFWCWLLWSSRRAKEAAAAAAAGASTAAGGGGAGTGAGAAGRSTRDMLRAYHKSTLGKG
jgi:hypothetical protein